MRIRRPSNDLWKIVLSGLRAAIAAFGFATALDVLGADVPLSYFGHTVWTERDGVPPKVFAMAQTEDGWLWLGGPTGLYQFDGIKFQEVRTDGGSRRLSVSVLYAMPSGELVIGLVSGGIISYDHGRFKHYEDVTTVGAGRVQNFTRDLDGVLWAPCINGLLRFDGTRWVSIGDEWNFRGGGAYSSTVDRRGTLWLANNKTLWKLPRGSKKFDAKTLSNREFGEFLQAADGRTWLLSERTGEVLPDQESGSFDSAEVRRNSLPSFVDSHGYYWSYGPDREGVPSARVLGLDAPWYHLLTALEDRDQNIWFAGNGGQLHRFRRPRFEKISGPANSLGNFPPAAFVPEEDGRVWVTLKLPPGMGGGTQEGAWLVDKELRRVQPLTSGGVLSRDPDGGIWYADARTVWRLVGKHAEPALAMPPDWGSEPPTSLAVGCAGGVWVAAPSKGLWRHDGSTWQKKGRIHQLPDDAPTRLLCDARRRLWLGFQDGTTVQLDGDGIRRIGIAQGLAVGGVTDISIGRHVLVAGERGLAIMVGERFQSLHAARPSAFEGLTGVAQSENGDVWLNGPGGMGRIRASDISVPRAGGEQLVPVETFDVGDGYPGPGFTRPYLSPIIAVDHLERVWVSGVEGLAYLDAKSLQPPQTASKAFVKNVVANGESRAASDTLALPKGTHTLRFDFTALNYTHPERLRFRHRLEGIDADWVVDEGRREANYANMGPGAYRFYVEASDETGVWPGEPTLMTLEIAPTFLQSWYFKALCLLALFALAACAHLFRLRQVAERQRRLLDERLFERERIARELHDTLLQSTQALILRVHAAAKEIPADSPTHTKLSGALQDAEDVLAEGRDRIQDLRARTDRLENLAKSLGAVGAGLAQGNQTELRTVVEGQAREIRQSVAEAAYLIGREALSNAFRHAHARSIEVQIVYGEEAFHLRVRDDGVGIDPKILEAGSAPGHWGLTGMAERAQKMGARLDLWSRVNTGMEVELTVPAAVAYRELPLKQRWLRQWRRVVAPT